MSTQENVASKIPTNEILTPNQTRFIDEYLIDLNGAQAAVRAGYSEKGASVQAVRLLAHPKIAAEVSARQRALQQAAEVTQEKVIRELAAMGFANMQDYIRVDGSGDPYVDLSNMSRAQAAAIQEITSETYIEGKGDEGREVKRTKFKLAPKTPALELLGKHLGMFAPRLDVKVTVEHKSALVDKILALLVDGAKVLEGSATEIPAVTLPAAATAQVEDRVSATTPLPTSVPAGFLGG